MHTYLFITYIADTLDNIIQFIVKTATFQCTYNLIILLFINNKQVK